MPNIPKKTVRSRIGLLHGSAAFSNAPQKFRQIESFEFNDFVDSFKMFLISVE
jgi:hypothetical protein